MADEFNIILEYMRKFDKRFDRLEEDMRTLKDDMSSVKHHMAGFMSSEARQDDEFAAIRDRLNRIEARLDIVDHEPH